jgi:hypothetical protein
MSAKTPSVEKLHKQSAQLYWNYISGSASKVTDKVIGRRLIPAKGGIFSFATTSRPVLRTIQLPRVRNFRQNAVRILSRPAEGVHCHFVSCRGIIISYISVKYEWTPHQSDEKTARIESWKSKCNFSKSWKRNLFLVSRSQEPCPSPERIVHGSSTIKLFLTSKGLKLSGFMLQNWS